MTYQKKNYAVGRNKNILCGFYPKQAGDARINDRPLDQNTYGVIYVLEGSGWLEDKQGRQSFEAGCLIQRFPGHAHRVIYRTEEAMNQVSVHVPIDILRLLHKDCSPALKETILTIGVRPDFLPRFEQGITLLRRTPENGLFRCVAFLHALLADLLSLAELAHLSPRMNQACRILEDRLDQSIPMEQAAKACHMSESHFRKVFTRVLGLSPGRYRIERRIEAAEQLLLTTPLSVKAIAQRLGYPDLYTFSRQFKKITGSSPTVSRQEGIR